MKVLCSLQLPSNELIMKKKIWVEVAVPRLSDVTGQTIHKPNIWQKHTSDMNFYTPVAVKSFTMM